MIIRPGMHIVLLMGGFGSEREISIKSGENCIEALKENDLKVTQLDLNQSTITEPAVRQAPAMWLTSLQPILRH